MVHSISFQDMNRFGGVMVSVLALSKEERGFDPRPGQTTDFENGICCYSTKQAAANTGRPRVRIMCQGKAACLPMDCYFRELAR